MTLDIPDPEAFLRDLGNLDEALAMKVLMRYEREAAKDGACLSPTAVLRTYDGFIEHGHEAYEPNNPDGVD